MTKLNLLICSFFFGVLALFLVYQHSGEWGQQPHGMHTWSQSDHFAITEGFVENNLDFFHPQTRVYGVYNKEYPMHWKASDSTTITSIDFPINQFIPAIAMKICGSSSPLFAQIYLFLIGLIGLIFLFRIAYHFNKSVVVSAVIVCFVSFCPVYFYYDLRFLPSVPCYSFAIIGFYYYVKYRSDESNVKWHVLFVVFLTLAALSRMTFVIPLLSVLFVELILLIKYRRHVRRTLTIVGGAILFFAAYLMYSQHIREAYGSLFLSAIRPAKSFAEFQEILQLIYERWKFQYLTKYHYAIGFILLIGVVFSTLKKRATPTFELQRLMIGTCVLGSLAFFVAMSAQFVDHDYYFIDNFMFPLSVVICIWSSHLISSNRILSIALPIVLVSLSLGMIRSNKWVQEIRIENERLGNYALMQRNFKDSDNYLNELGVSKSATILVLTPTAPNYSLQGMKRNGFVSLLNDVEGLKLLFNMPFDYVIFQNDWFVKELYANQPEIISRLKTVGTNGKITVCKIEDVPNQTLYSFFQLNDRTPRVNVSMDEFSSKLFTNLGKNTAPDSVWNFGKTDEYAPLLQLNQRSLFRKTRILLVEGEVKLEQGKLVNFVTSLSENAKPIYYQSTPISGTDDWVKIQYVFTLPESTTKLTDMGAYIYNNEHHNYSVRNFSIKLF